MTVDYLVDTNVLLRFTDRGDPQHALVRNAIRKLTRAGHNLTSSSQNRIEMWNVATRPLIHNGLGLSLPLANRSLRLVERVFPMLADSPAIYAEWRRLVVAFGVSGAQVHDTRLVATMIAHGISHILTLNTADFVRFASAGIVAVHPASV